MEIHRSARKHGVKDADIHHAIRHRIYDAVLEDELFKRLYLGPDRAARILEIITIRRLDEDEMVIHAMAARPLYLRLIRKR